MFDDQLPPAKLYKYCPLDGGAALRERLSNILVRHSLWCGSPLLFNDPYDCMPYLDMSGTPAQKRALVQTAGKRVLAGLPRTQRKAQLRDAIKRTKGSRAFDDALRAWNHTLEQMGVLCLTEEPESLLMWGHYASSHRGVVLGFRTEDQPFVLAQKVSYSDTRPTWRRFSDDYVEALPRILRVKARPWHYEKEWRVFRAGSTQPLPFNPALLSDVILGAKISGDDERWVRASLSEMTHVAVTRASLDRRTYSLTREPVA